MRAVLAVLCVVCVAPYSHERCLDRIIGSTTRCIKYAMRRIMNSRHLGHGAAPPHVVLPVTDPSQLVRVSSSESAHPSRPPHTSSESSSPVSNGRYVRRVCVFVCVCVCVCPSPRGRPPRPYPSQTTAAPGPPPAAASRIRVSTAGRAIPQSDDSRPASSMAGPARIRVGSQPARAISDGRRHARAPRACARQSRIGHSARVGREGT